MERFPDGARVCFVGDSITCANIYLSYIASYYRNNFKDSGIKFFNCGVSGGEIINCINTYEYDIANYSPTHVVLMIGVNDSCRTELEKEPSAERYSILKAAYDGFRENVRRFYEMLLEKGVKLIICTQAPYAEYQKNGVNPLRGGYALMLGYAEFIRSFAKENGIDLCDYHANMTKLIQDSVLFSEDCVHPNAQGYFEMAKIFLASQGLLLESDEISPELKEWRDTVARLRSIYTVEYLAIPEQYKLTDEERYEKIKEVKAEIENGTWTKFPFLYDKMVDYLERDKKREAEYIEFLKSFS